MKKTVDLSKFSAAKVKWIKAAKKLIMQNTIDAVEALVEAQEEKMKRKSMDDLPSSSNASEQLKANRATFPLNVPDTTKSGGSTKKNGFLPNLAPIVSPRKDRPGSGENQAWQENELLASSSAPILPPANAKKLGAQSSKIPAVGTNGNVQKAGSQSIKVLATSNGTSISA